MNEALKIGFPHNVIYKGTNYEFMDASKGYGDDLTAEFGLAVEDIIDISQEFDLSPNDIWPKDIYLHQTAAYHSHYIVKGKRLLLDSLYIEQGEAAFYPNIKSIPPIEDPNHPKGRYYHSIKYHVRLSGSILIGKPWPYLKNRRDYIGKVCRYNKVVMLYFKDGILKEERTSKISMKAGRSSYHAGTGQFITHEEVIIRSDLQPEMSEDIKKHPPIPLLPLTIIQGVPYQFIIGYRKGDIFRCRNWPQYAGVWNAIWKNTLEDSLSPTEAEIVFPMPKKIVEWNWPGVTEEFEFKDDGKLYLQNVYLHLGKNCTYPKFKGIDPKILFHNPMIQYYENTEFECQKSLNGKFLLGKRSRPKKIPWFEFVTDGFFLDIEPPEANDFDYDTYIEITVHNGMLENIQDVTELIHQIDEWIKIKPENGHLKKIEEHYPKIIREHCYWFSKYGEEYE